MKGVHPLAAMAQMLAPVAQPAPLRRLEVRENWQAAYLVQHGFRVEYRVRGNRIFMVRS